MRQVLNKALKTEAHSPLCELYNFIEWHLAMQTRSTRRNQTHDEEIDLRTDEREQSSEDDATPSASFIGTANPARNLQMAEKPTELGWKVYSLKEKKMRIKLRIEFMKTWMEEYIIPKGLTIDLRSITA